MFSDQTKGITGSISLEDLKDLIANAKNAIEKGDLSNANKIASIFNKDIQDEAKKKISSKNSQLQGKPFEFRCVRMPENMFDGVESPTNLKIDDSLEIYKLNLSPRILNCFNEKGVEIKNLSLIHI